MPKTRTKKVHARPSGKKKAATSPLREVTADGVIQNLLDLFKHLEINVSHPVSRAHVVADGKIASHTVYPHASAISGLLTAWHQDSNYLDNLGNPLPIKRRGSTPSFRSLAERIVPNIDESYLLSELERLGAVIIDKSGLIHVQTRSFPVYEDKRLAVQHTLKTLDCFISTLRHNLNSTPSNSDQLFHRIASNADFDFREIPALKVRAKRHGQSFLESFDNWLMRKALTKSRLSRSREKRVQVSIGVYLSVENM